MDEITWGWYILMNMGGLGKRNKEKLLSHQKKKKTTTFSSSYCDKA